MKHRIRQATPRTAVNPVRLKPTSIRRNTLHSLPAAITTTNKHTKANKATKRIFHNAETFVLESKPSVKTVLSVLLPYYRAGYIGWIPFESLTRQVNVDFPWEIIVIEEDFNNPYGLANVVDYWPKLQEVNCCRIKYIRLKKWVPLAAKWYYLINSCFPTTEVVCFNASDIYMSPERLSRQFKILTSGKYNWYKLSGHIIYDVCSFQHVKLINRERNRGDTCCRAATWELAKAFDLDCSSKGVDGKMYRAYLNQGLSDFYDVNKSMIYHTVNITGLGMITLDRSNRVQKVIPPMQTCCSSLEAHLPKEVATKLYNARQFVAIHNRSISEG